MKIIDKNPKKQEVCVQIQSLDDLWSLSKIIEIDDCLFGKTERKIKIGDQSTDRNVKVIRKTVVLGIQAEKIEYEPSLHTLRVTGKIIDGPEDIPRGDYHSFTLRTDNQITIQKKEWLHID
ncbi:MAG: mRNA surveillance protein Pelota, partial [Candidatus Woesearchaeota archaeon]